MLETEARVCKIKLAQHLKSSRNPNHKVDVVKNIYIFFFLVAPVEYATVSHRKFQQKLFRHRIAILLQWKYLCGTGNISLLASVSIDIFLVEGRAVNCMQEVSKEVLLYGIPTLEVLLVELEAS